VFLSKVILKSESLDAQKNRRIFQHYADKLFTSVLESIDNKMCNSFINLDKINGYSNKIVSQILEASYEDFMPAMKQTDKYLSFEKLADCILKSIFYPVIMDFQSGLLEYSEVLSCEIVISAIKTASRRLYVNRVANLYAEKLTLRVFRDFFIHIITDANRIAYHLLGSYEAVSKNQLRTFAENIIENIMSQLFPKKRLYESSEASLLELYAESLSYDITESAVECANK